jgi:hypothetical protein
MHLSPELRASLDELRWISDESAILELMGTTIIGSKAFTYASMAPAVAPAKLVLEVNLSFTSKEVGTLQGM